MTNQPARTVLVVACLSLSTPAAAQPVRPGPDTAPPRKAAGPPPARTPPPRTPPAEDAKALAKHHFEIGMGHYQKGEYARAARAFLKAYKYSQHHVIVYNLALAYAMKRDWVNAATYLKVYLVKKPDAAGKLPRQLRKARRRVATLVIEVPDPKAEIFIDGKRRGRGRVEVYVLPGKRAVEIRLNDQIAARKVFDLARGTERHWEITTAAWAAARKKPEPRPRPRPRPRPVRPGGSGLGRLHWAYFTVAAVLTAAAAGVSAWTSVKTKQLHDDYMDDRSNRTLYNDGRRFRTLSTAMWGAAGGLAAVTVLLAVFTRWGKPERQTAVTAAPLFPAGASLTVTWGP